MCRAGANMAGGAEGQTAKAAAARGKGVGVQSWTALLPYFKPWPLPPSKPPASSYCYAVDRFVGSYCEPGLGGTGKPFELPGEP